MRTTTVQAGEIARAYAEVNAIEWERVISRPIRCPAVVHPRRFRAWLARFAGNFIS